LARRGQWAAAEAICRNILKSSRRHFDAGCLLGASLLQQNQAEAAADQFRRSLKFAPSDASKQSIAELYSNNGVALVNLNRLEEALTSFEHAIALRPDLLGAQVNMTSALHRLGRFDAALALSDRMIAAHPRLADAHYARGRALDRLHRFEEALASFNQAIQLKPDFHDAYYGRSLCRLMLGRFLEGWEDGEHRWLSASYPAKYDPTYAPPSLSRENLTDTRLLVVAEQGTGDEIMFASMIPDLCQDARSVSLECDPRFIGLFGRSFRGVKLVVRNNPPNWNALNFDYVIPAQSLGRLYRNALSDFPKRRSFLKASDEITAKWKRRLSDLGDGLKVGISWRGGAEFTRRRDRSIPLDLFIDNLNLGNARLVSLQYGQVKEEVDAANHAGRGQIVRFETSEIDDFDELAGLVMALDLIITVDNTLAHLCGAIGKSCRVLLPYVPEWRYGPTGNRMPWYSSLELYRQDKPGDFGPAIERAVSDIKYLQQPQAADT
jgi:tetratricopeptide (TPR) repeat protein